MSADLLLLNRTSETNGAVKAFLSLALQDRLVAPKLTAEGTQDKGAAARVDFSLK